MRSRSHIRVGNVGLGTLFPPPMIIDARRLRGGHIIEADLCVVGAGPAGLTLAREFEGTATRVVVLESGRFDVDDDAQSLNEGTTTSTHHLDEALAVGRRRQFGGATNLWVHHTDPDDGRRHARMLLPEAIDFADWPVDRKTLLPFYAHAHHTCRLGPWSYDTERWTGGGPGPWPFERVTTVVCHYCASDVFTGRYRDDAKASENVTVVQNATVVEIETDGDRTMVDGVRAARFDGEWVQVRARRFVLVGGGIENARLLLVSGLGNEFDVVGRFVMDHPEFRLGVVEPDDTERFRSMAFYDLRWVDGAMVSGLLTLREDVKRREGLKNLCCMVVAKSKGTGSETEKAIKAAVLAAPSAATDGRPCATPPARSPGSTRPWRSSARWTGPSRQGVHGVSCRLVTRVGRRASLPRLRAHRCHRAVASSRQPRGADRTARPARAARGRARVALARGRPAERAAHTRHPGR